MHILAISGSLRAASSNSAILRTASLVSPAGVVVHVHTGLDDLPYFNPDLDRDLDDPQLPAAVKALRVRIALADALLISSPEYAHGVSGMMKNALDWLVGGAEMVGKPLALVNTSPHATHAIAAIAETLRTMSATIVDDACLTLAVPRNCSDAELAADPYVHTSLRGALERLALAARRDGVPPELRADGIHRA